MLCPLKKNERTKTKPKMRMLMDSVGRCVCACQCVCEYKKHEIVPEAEFNFYVIRNQSDRLFHIPEKD